MRDSSFISEIFIPLISTLPEEGFSSPPMRFNSVDLPHPDFPNTATVSPGDKIKSKLFSTAVSLLPSE